MPEQTKPTALVFKVLEGQYANNSIGIGIEGIETGSGHYPPVALTFSKEMAIDIVKRWNNHDELLEACNKVYEHILLSDDDAFDSYIPMLTAVIAKAEQE